MKKYSIEFLKAAHKYSSYNKGMLQNSIRCGCFCCCQIYDPAQIKNYMPMRANDQELAELLATAWCPLCGIDSVIPDASGFPITPEFLNEMKEYYF